MATIAAAPARLSLRTLNRWWLVLGIVVVWVVLWIPLRGTATLPLDASELTPLHRSINGFRDTVASERGTNLFFVLCDQIRVVVDGIATFVQGLISQPAFGRPVPVIGWLGVVAIAATLSFVLANVWVAILALVGFASLGLLGLWEESMDTLALTLVAVMLSLLFAIPLGIWAGLSNRFNRFITPVLDFMQAMPTFVYLAPLTLFFLIGPASAVIATLIYAAPPTIRITAHAIRSVQPQAVEAAISLGSTPAQVLGKVRLPLAKRTIVLGINQTIMAALAMVTIAALIDAPGLGQTVIRALETLDVGTAFNAGLGIVILAIVLDRVTTAASARVEKNQRSGQANRQRLRRYTAIGLTAASALAVYFSTTYLWASEFPTTGSNGVAGQPVIDAVNVATGWVQTNLGEATLAVKNAVTAVLLNPLQALLEQSPWFLVAAAILGFAYVLAGLRAAITAAICLGLLVATGLWQDAMVTLAMTLVATVIVMVLGVVIGVWMGRRKRVDRIIRPVLDAAQVMPSFVYLVPFVGLFAASRFTAIIAAIVFAAPVAIKLVADGIRGVSPTAVEAAISSGSSTWQVITKVQLPMASKELTLAANQGLIYVLSMVVVGGLVGAGALGYDVVAGFSQAQLYGKGLAAGVAIVMLGIMLDRVTQAAAQRVGRGHARTAA